MGCSKAVGCPSSRTQGSGSTRWRRRSHKGWFPSKNTPYIKSGRGYSTRGREEESAKIPRLTKQSIGISLPFEKGNISIIMKSIGNHQRTPLQNSILTLAVVWSIETSPSYCLPLLHHLFLLLWVCIHLRQSPALTWVSELQWCGGDEA